MITPWVQDGDIWRGPLGGAFVASTDEHGMLYLQGVTGDRYRVYLTPTWAAYMITDSWELVDRKAVTQ